MKYQSRRISKTKKAIIIILLAYSGLLLMDYSTNHQHNGTICFFKLITGQPCPGCGLGRATLALLKGNVTESFQYNILCIPITFCIIISFLWLIIDLFRQKETFFKTINRPIKIIYFIPFIIVTALSWYINIVRGI